MKEEMNSMRSNEVWDLVELPNGAKAIGCNIERYKARLVAKGFNPKEGIDYTETFSPIHRDRSRGILGLSQETYINKVLERFRMKDCSPSPALIVRGDKFSLDQCPKNDFERESMKNIPYASVVGCLGYIQVCTRPDIAFAVGMLGRYQSDLGLDHWRAAKKVLRYLKGTKDYKLVFRKMNTLDIVGYFDSDFAGCIDSRKSTSGNIFIMAGGAISWRSVKQTLVTTSTMEAEFRSREDRDYLREWRASVAARRKNERNTATQKIQGQMREICNRVK
ncbi:secreted RxLR effector protein 161-like [Ipomoea triloba]|uniref:secreted RxLR effector protein 161-like n=1 Tax=Ipomoea triloba TaxID=35885 RepID=UPI00125E5F7A|nr:secreted RxLR effector protein 161-like [Ipomoea triloba]